jgi:hypothetical protein
VKTHKLGSAPITDTEYAELLGNIGKLPEKDRKALRARARAYELPAALSVAENALRSVFRPLFDLAWSLSAKQIVPYTTDEQIAAEGQMVARWNALAEQHGVSLRLELCGTAELGKGGVRFRELEPNAGLKAIEILMPSVTPDKWMSDVFFMLSLLMASDPVHPAMFEAQAARHWDKRLRQRVAGKDFVDLADSRDRAILGDERRRKDTMDRIDSAAATWNAALDRQGVEGIIPTTWPMRWTQSGPIPARKPHEPDTQGPIDNRRGALTPFPIEWRVGIGPNTRSLDASDLQERKIALSSAVRSIQLNAALKLLYLHKRKRLLPPLLQRLLQRIDRLYRNIWNNFQLDTRTLPVYVDEVGIVEVKDTNDRQGNDSNNEPDNSRIL